MCRNSWTTIFSARRTECARYFCSAIKTLASIEQGSFVDAVRATYEYYKVVEALSEDERLIFYESFSVGLTVATRMLLGDPRIGERDKLKRVELINDILHGSTAKIPVMRLKLHEWTEDDFWRMVASDVSRDLAIAPLVDYAARGGLDAVKSNIPKN